MVNLNREGMDFPLPIYPFKINEDYVIYGTGEVASSFYKTMLKTLGKDCVKYFLDSSSSFVTYKGKKVLKPSEIPNQDKKKMKFILASFTSNIGMEAELKKNGILSKFIIKNNRYTFPSLIQNLVQVKKIFVYPKAKEDIWKELLTKINNYIPALKKYNISIENGIEKDSDIYDLILIWDKKYLNDILVKNKEMAYCIDPSFFQFIDIKILIYINYFLEKEEQVKNSKVSICNLLELKKIIGDNAYVLGTGPSLTKGVQIIKNLDTKTSLCVTCNGGINSKVLMSELKPNLYVISDIGYLMEEFQKTMDRIVEYIYYNNCYLVIYDWWIPLIQARYPQIAEKLIGINDEAKQIHFPQENDMSVYGKAHNVITRFAIPIASSICKTIYISGCDGVDITEQKEFIFSHESSIGEIKNQEGQQYQYYLQHYNYFEELLQYGEQQGKEYFSLTPSYIPALSKRIKQLL